jgi:hypothetical protein
MATASSRKSAREPLARYGSARLDDDLIIEVHERPAPELYDERRRYYRITAFGRAVARAEASRLTDLVKLARASGFIPKRA